MNAESFIPQICLPISLYIFKNIQIPVKAVINFLITFSMVSWM